ncbi:MAG: Stp1/IreP family PP2C-type Ser/Thr phosphatase [Deltaproteobacteria bacterium]|nr:Stp1/IreP family PP2C-type Ser/Thr phosphatase [Deltaproteobacteria bacterium]
MIVRVFGRTDVGLVREHNEDNFLIADLTANNRSIRPEVRTHAVGNKGSLFVVCDGMGGAAAGEVASQIAVDTVFEMMQPGEPPTDAVEIARRLDKAISEAGVRIYTAAKLDRGQRGMGTTVTAAVVIGRRLVFGQVGDSRAHVIRKGRLVQVTKDQSLVQQLIDAKQLTAEEARNFDKSNIILQALGTAEEVHVDMTSIELRRGDALVMCSDGLSGPVEADKIQAAVEETDDPLEACRKLTELACAGGGQDNITVIVARFEGDGLAEPTADDLVAYEKFAYAQVTETTSRRPYPKDPREKATPTPTPVPPEVKDAAPPASPEASADKTPERPRGAASEEGAPDARFRRKLMAGIGIAAAVVVAISAIAYAMTSSNKDGARGGEGQDASMGVLPAALAPVPAGPSGAKAKTDDEPVLPPTPESAILGADKAVVDTGATDKRATGEEPRPRVKNPDGTNPEAKPKEPVKSDDTPAADAVAPKKRPSKAAADIPENPF